MQTLKWILLAVIGLVAVTLVAARLGAFNGTMPLNLGHRDGKLKPPSKTPNSVSSQADMWVEHPMQDYARISPIAPKGGGPATIARIEAIVAAMPGARVVTKQSDYLYVQFSTRLMRFVDDAEFWFDPASGLVQVRSASRLGRKDFGVNRARIEAIRARLEAG